MSKKEKIIKNLGYSYDKDELMKCINENANFLLNKAQLMMFFPHLTSNRIKYITSPRCNKEDYLPHVRDGRKPKFNYHIVNQYMFKRTGVSIVETSEEPESKKGKKGKTG